MDYSRKHLGQKGDRGGGDMEFLRVLTNVKILGDN